MITLKGEKMVSRVAASLLTAIGMEELVCNSYSGKHNDIELGVLSMHDDSIL